MLLLFGIGNREKNFSGGCDDGDVQGQDDCSVEVKRWAEYVQGSESNDGRF